MTKADDIKTLRDASAALADIADRISCGGPKPDFTIARQVAVNRFNASPIWKKLKGTPWENDAPTIAAELMCMYAAECRVVSSLMAGEGENRRQELHERFKNRPGLNAQMDVQAPPSIDDYAPPSSGEFERGWNEAIEACLERIRRKYQYTVANPLYAANYPSEANAVKDMRDLVRALRKPAQEEVK